MKARRRPIQVRHLARNRWVVRDDVLGHRICNCYQETKYPDFPSHIHDHWDQVVAPCTIRTPEEAEAIMQAYHRRHTMFELHRLQQEIDTHGNPHHA